MTDTAHTLRVAEITLETAYRNHREAQQALFDARRNVAVARLAHAEANPHPWIGRKVKKTVKVWPNKTRVQQGTVTLMNADYGGYRNHTPQSGELFVKTAGGATAYKFDDAWELT